MCGNAFNSYKINIDVQQMSAISSILEAAIRSYQTGHEWTSQSNTTPYESRPPHRLEERILMRDQASHFQDTDRFFVAIPADSLIGGSRCDYWN